MLSPSVDSSRPSDALAGVRVIFVTHDYWPDEVGIAPYATETAEALAAAGAEVVALTMPSHYPEWKVPEGTPRGYRLERRNGVDIWRLPTYVPSSPTLVRRLAFEASWFLAATPVALRKRIRSADVVVCVHPGLFASAFAATIAGDRPLMAIVQDLVGQAAGQSGMAGAARAQRVIAGIERWALGRASVITVPTDRFIDPLVAAGVRSDVIQCVPNWSRVAFAPVEVADARKGTGWKADDFVMVHAGNMGLKQGLPELASMIEEAATTRPWLRFAFIGSGSQRGEVERALLGYPNVEIHGLLPQEEFVPKLLGANALLLSERATVTDMCLPSKLTTYFAAGRPVVAMTGASTATAEEVRRSGAGKVVAPGDAAAFLEVVDNLRNDGVHARLLGEAGRRYCQATLTPSVQLARLVDLLPLHTRRA